MDLFRLAPSAHAGTSNAPDSITDNSASFVDRGGALPAPVAFIQRRFAPQFENTSKKKEASAAIRSRSRRRIPWPQKIHLPRSVECSCPVHDRFTRRQSGGEFASPTQMRCGCPQEPLNNTIKIVSASLYDAGGI
jgi:hypothetical protein